MNTEELTPIVTAHQSAISRHDLEMASIRATLQESATQQAAQVAKHDAAIAEIYAILHETAKSQAQNQAAQAINTQAIANLTAGMLDLRNQVADYIQSRTQTN